MNQFSKILVSFFLFIAKVNCMGYNDCLIMKWGSTVELKVEDGLRDERKEDM